MSALPPVPDPWQRWGHYGSALEAREAFYFLYPRGAKQGRWGRVRLDPNGEWPPFILDISTWPPVESDGEVALAILA